MTVSDASRLSPDDDPVLTLRDGRKITLYFGYRGLKSIESRFGSFQKFTDGLSNTDGPQFTTMLEGLAFAGWKSGITVDDLEENLDPSELDKHMEILGEALMRSFPKETKKAAEDATNPATPTQQPGDVALLRTSQNDVEAAQIGGPTTTPQLSSFTEPKSSSGI